MSNVLISKLNRAEFSLQRVINSEKFINPCRIVLDKQINVDKLCDRLNSAKKSIFSQNEAALKTLCAKLDALSPFKAFSRGYSVALKNNKQIKSVDRLSIDDKIEIIFNDGNVSATITDIYRGENDGK